MKMISFIGSEKADFAYYVSQILKAQEKPLLVLDNSRDGALFHIVSRDNESAMLAGSLEHKNTLYVRNRRPVNKELLEKFDFCLCFNGLSNVSNIVLGSDYIYVMPEYHLVVMERVKELVSVLGDDEKARIRVMMRDLVTDKISDLAVARELQVDPSAMIGNLLLDMDDEAKYISMQYNGRQRVKGLTKEYVTALSYVIAEVLDVKEKEAVKIVQKA